MNYLFIINDGPYGSERPYNALRLAMNVAKKEGEKGAPLPSGRRCAMCRQRAGYTAGYYNIERMLTSILRNGEVAT